MNEFALTSTGWTHAALVHRAASWLHTRLRCRVVLTEQTTGGGEIPDAIGWKFLTESHLIEAKVSRADFFADRLKPFRCVPATGMGTYRYFMVPAGIVTVDDLAAHCPGWGLLEVKGRSVYVTRKPIAQPAKNETQEIAQLTQALMQAQLRIEEPLHSWLTGPDSPVGRFRASQREERQRLKDAAAALPSEHARNRQWLLEQQPLTLSEIEL